MKGVQWRELIAAVGVILSLLFVGFQIRQNTQVARGQTRQDLAALNQEWLVLQSQDSQFNAIWRKGWSHSSTDLLSVSEQSRADWMMRLNLRRIENVFFQYSEGLVDESALNSYGLQASKAFQSTAFDKYWRSVRGGFDPHFVKFFETKMEIR
jgi:hypothetical protein